MFVSPISTHLYYIVPHRGTQCIGNSPSHAWHETLHGCPPNIPRDLQIQDVLMYLCVSVYAERIVA